MANKKQRPWWIRLLLKTHIVVVADDKDLGKVKFGVKFMGIKF